MGLIDDIKSLFDGPKDPAKKLLYGRVRSIDSLPAPVKPGTAYVQWWLSELWLRYDREWLSHYHPLVYSNVKMNVGPREISIPITLGADEFSNNTEFTNLNKAIKLNYKMTPLVPYNSGSIEIAAALIGAQ